MNQAYIFLDSTRSTSQIVQHQVIRAYALERNLNISFYGAEFIGLELRHKQLNSYITNGKIKNFIFYTIDQFYQDRSGFDFAILSTGLSLGICFYFAAEKREILTFDDLHKLLFESKVCTINRNNCYRSDLLQFRAAFV